MRDPRHVAGQAWGWSLSMLVHALVVAAAIGLVSDLRLAPQPEPFRWMVSQVPGPVLSSQQPTATAVTSSHSPEPAPQPEREKALKANPDILSPSQTIQASTPTVHAMEASPPTISTNTGIPIARSPVMADAQAPPASQASPQPASTPTASQDMAQDSQAVPQAQQPRQSTEAPQTALLSPEPQASPVESSTAATPAKADYGWLAQTLRTRIEGLKRYPPQARSSRLEGRVVLRAVIGDAGELVDLTVLESSGHPVLDNAAVEVLKQACPLSLPHPLGRPRVVVQVPISYQLR